MAQVDVDRDDTHVGTRKDPLASFGLSKMDPWVWSGPVWSGLFTKRVNKQGVKGDKTQGDGSEEDR